MSPKSYEISAKQELQFEIALGVVVVEVEMEIEGDKSKSQIGALCVRLTKSM